MKLPDSGRRKYRVALVGGAGTWGSKYLAAYAAHPDCQVVALVDTAAQRRADFARHYDIAQHCDHIDVLFARQVPDIVSAIVPVAANPAIVSACARAGVRVVSCEKPLAVSLDQADTMLADCQRAGTVLSCGSVYSGVPYLSQTLEWMQSGALGSVTSAAIPGGLPDEAAGGGCVQLTLLRLLTGLDAVWAQGWSGPPRPDWTWTPGTAEADKDGPAWGRLGLAGGVECSIAEPGQAASCIVAVEGENGRLELTSQGPVLVQNGATVRPGFAARPWASDYFSLRIERLVRAFDTGVDELDSGRGYHHALEIALALKLSARQGHRRVDLPLADRSMQAVPYRYRMEGGDIAGFLGVPPTV
ncbi:MAG: hypothetical protein GKR89_00915 [Candidatus Latescibacteria bacterium]|nr:hypothetical protein [Candidatus Latescibacterota bacterium]